MYPLLLGLLPLLVALSDVDASCHCLCVDGSAQTLCTALDPARRGVDACTAAVDCSQAPTASTESPVGELTGESRTLGPPPAGAYGCWQARVAASGQSEYRRLALCHVYPEGSDR